MARPSTAVTETSPGKLLSRRVFVTIFRDQTENVAKVVWAHEIPLLEAMHGEGNVRAVDPTQLDEGYTGKPSADLLPFNKKQDPVLPPSETASLDWAFTGSLRTEYERLSEVYGRHPEINETMCEHVYGRFQRGDFARVVGTPELADLPDSQLREMLAGYGVESSVRAAADRSALLRLAQEAGVQIG